MVQEIEEAEEDIHEGRVYSHKEVKKNAKRWIEDK